MYVLVCIISKPGMLKQFIEDLHSGKLHREFHQGPDPTPSPVVPQVEQVTEVSVHTRISILFSSMILWKYFKPMLWVQGLKFPGARVKTKKYSENQLSYRLGGFCERSFVCDLTLEQYH